MDVLMDVEGFVDRDEYEWSTGRLHLLVNCWIRLALMVC